MAVDPQIGVDSYDRPKVVTESETLVSNMLTLLFGKPGFYPSIPRLGMNVQQYLYMFEDEMDTSALKNQLASQCKDFVSIIENGSFDIITSRYKDQPLLIFVIPAKIANSGKNLLLGVTINDNGEFKFNFTFDDTSYN